MPTPDHFIPMLYLAGLGAADDHPPAVLDTMIQGYCYGSLSMTSYALGCSPVTAVDDAPTEEPLPTDVPPESTNL